MNLIHHNDLMLSWKDAFRYPTACPSGRRSLIRAGIWMLLCPPVGWLLALGYRANCAWALWDNATPTLPEWAPFVPTFTNGTKALAVIYAHLLIPIILFWVLGVDSFASAKAHWFEILGATVAIGSFIPALLPLLLFVFPQVCEWIHFTALESALIAISFAFFIFILPAAFLQVSITRRFRSAMSLGRTLRLIGAGPRAYLEAWAISLVATLAALCCGPILPWTIPWSYLVISFAFNQALTRMDIPEVQEQFGKSAFASLGPRPAKDTTGQPLFPFE